MSQPSAFDADLPSPDAPDTQSPAPATPDTPAPAPPDSGPVEASPSPGDPSADPRGDRVAAAVQGWQRELVDLGGRNNLLWYRDLPSGTLDLSTAHPSGVAKLLAGGSARLSDLVREQAALDEARRRARLIRAKTTELREERGIATCFLAIGLATWTVPGSPRPPAAPILLRDCTLRPITPAHNDYEVTLSGEVELNPVLLHYLRSEHDLDPDVAALEDLATAGGGFDPTPMYAALSALCSDLGDFEVITRLVVGTFSYAKLPMVADLGAQGDSLADHDVIAALAGDVTALRSVRTDVPEGPADPDPAREYLILDADSTQQAVIDGVRSGANLVIQGPPGTGKSQTIANLIAVLAAEGKRVLFVAEKRAAIDAVLGRLERVGLSDLVLDAYEGASSRRQIARSFGVALDNGIEAAALSPDTTRTEAKVRDLRDTLAGHAAALHEAREPWGVTAYAAQEAIAVLSRRRPAPTSRVRLRADALAGLTRDRVDDLTRQLTEAAEHGAWASSNEGDHAVDPWFGARITSGEQAVRAQEVVGRLSGEGLAELESTVHGVFDDVKLPAAQRLSDFKAVMGTVGRVRSTLEVFRPEVFDMPLDDLVAATSTTAYRRAHDIDLGWLDRVRLTRDAKRLLRPGSPPEDLHAALAEAQEQRVAWQRLAGAGGRPEIPADLDRAQAAYDAVEADLLWLGERLETTVEGGDLLDLGISELRDRLGALAARPERLAVLPAVTGALDALVEAGLGPLVDDLAARSVPPADVAAELEFVWWASIAEDLTVRDARYGGHHGEQLRRIGHEYVEADTDQIGLGALRVRAATGRRLVEVLADHGDQESLVRAEAGKARRHRSLRDLLPRAGETLTAIKPCWAMSPLVVASLLPPGRWFDVVIFDEASQIPPGQAVSAISRANQVVVAGDSKQLPPTAFFTTATAEGERGAPPTGDGESLTDGFESILDVLAAALPSRQLEWHYRSLDERLIGFANEQMYDGDLVTFPSTGVEPVVTLSNVDGTVVLQPGMDAIESTDAEVDRVVELVLAHARSRPHESLGVIALGLRHATRLEEGVRRALSSAPDVAAFFDEDRAERFFVKNLERVQGDERDAVILSVGYGKTSMGRVLHRFGPLNLDGGERRLNVAVTRARRRMTVVSALTANDLDPARLKARGAIMLRDFLAYAEAAQASSPASAVAAAVTGGTDVSDPLRTDFARRLREAGLVVHETFGTSQHPIDVAIEDPLKRGRIIMAVETDGPLYAGMRSTRDRDRLRPEQLRRLGWHHERVWSTDLFRDPARDVARVVRVANALSVGADPRVDPGPVESAAHGADEGAGERAVPARAAEQPPIPARVQREAFELDWSEHPESEPMGHQTPSDEPPGEAPTGDEASDAPPTVEAGPESPTPRTSTPEQTSDDTDAGWGEPAEQDQHDRWLHEQRPPHWGSD